jgi:hypothetical protein
MSEPDKGLRNAPGNTWGTMAQHQVLFNRANRATGKQRGMGRRKDWGTMGTYKQRVWCFNNEHQREVCVFVLIMAAGFMDSERERYRAVAPWRA